jgi:ribosome-associated protein
LTTQQTDQQSAESAHQQTQDGAEEPFGPPGKQAARPESDVSSRTKAAYIAEAADDKRALDILTLDLQGITLVADFFVICSGTSDVHIRAITNGIEEDLKKKYGIRPSAVQGREDASWVILDYGDVVAHVFSESEREFYDLESFWKHARVVEKVLAGRPSSRVWVPGQENAGGLDDDLIDEDDLDEGLAEDDLREGDLREGDFREGDLREGDLREGDLREGDRAEGDRHDDDRHDDDRHDDNVDGADGADEGKVKQG